MIVRRNDKARQRSGANSETWCRVLIIRITVEISSCSTTTRQLLNEATSLSDYYCDRERYTYLAALTPVEEVSPASVDLQSSLSHTGVRYGAPRP